MLIKRQVLIKSIVTEALKKDLIEKFNKLIDLSEKRLNEINSEEKKFLLTAPSLEPNYLQAIRGRLKEQKEEEERVKESLIRERENIKNLKEGEIYLHGYVDSFVDFKEGDDFFKKLEKAEITLKDSKIIEIKNE
ncbi:MAG TPA: YlqD family protein [Caldisericia bacterium]|nr:YlqD family protein [Caldisericia bacterium]